MKKLFLAMIVCAGFCACSNDDVVVTTTPNEVLGEATAYLKVNIKDVNSGTRASSDGYAYGTEDEQTVNNAYFYFYDKDGNYMAKGNVGETSGTAATETTPGNIEWESGTVVAVWGLSSGDLPTQMLTVLNKPSGVDFTNKTLSDALATLAGTPYGESGNFVMSTSVYYNSGIVNTTALTENNFAPEPVDLEGDYGTDGDYTAVDVYVERLAAKVGVGIESGILWNNANQGGKLNIEVTDKMFEDFAKTPEEVSVSTYVIQLLGWDVDCVARDAYVVKDIDDFASSWTNSPAFNGWNTASDYRCYWAESPNYGDESTVYPTSSNGNTATEEGNSSTWLNEYLRYVDLQEPVDFSNTTSSTNTTTYCGENTNTVAVLGDASSTGLTNMIVKAQFGLENNNSGSFDGVDLVKYHGEYLTLADFEADMITEVMNYDFKGMVEEVEDALKNSSLGTNPFTSGYSTTLVDALEPAVYCKKTSEENANYELFDSRFMQLYSQSDGKVSIWFDTTTSVATDNSSHNNHSDHYGYEIPGYYTATALIKEAEDSMDDYTFYFKFDADKLETLGTSILEFLESLGFVTVDKEASEEGVLVDNYYMPLTDLFTINVYKSDGTVDHSYTARNYLIRAIEREAAGIDDDWSTAGYPYYYNGGLMYYNVPIEHLASAGTNGALVEAEYGVVRNHWYNITVTSVSNFGHAIANEDEVIVPQPEEDYYYLGATIDILSWKMINQSVGF